MSEYQSIITPQDADRFIEEANGLHDGHVTYFEYVNDGIVQRNDELFFDYSKVNLKMKVLITSLEGHPTVDIVFRNVYRVQFYSVYLPIYSIARLPLKSIRSYGQTPTLLMISIYLIVPIAKLNPSLGDGLTNFYH